MTAALPRVTYSNIGVDFSPVHDHIDAKLAAFEAKLGKDWPADFAGGAVFEPVSPIDGRTVLGRFRQSTAADISAAVDAAANAYRLWSRTSTEERSAFAGRWQKALDEAKYDIALAALYEIGKSRIEAIGEAEEAVDIVEYYGSELQRHAGYGQSMRELIQNESAKSVLRPLGVFGVIAPFNFPVALSVNMIAGAILAGNSVVYKPSPDCALTGHLILQTLKAAGAPEGLVNIVQGGRDVGEALVASPKLAGIAFTGSHAVGMEIFRKLAAGRHAKPVVADMGGKNPAYISAKANLAKAAEGVARSAFGLQGQKCSACSAVYVQASVRDSFVEQLRAFASKLKVGDPRKRDTFMGPVYNDAAARRLEDAIEEARRDGEVLFGGNRLQGVEGNYFEPTVVQLPAGHRLLQDELFAPFVAIVTVDSLEEGIRLGNAVNYGLAAGIYSADENEVSYFLDNAEAGVLYANRASGATTGAWPGSQPFCGWKGSGVSAKGGLGPHYLPQFMREQSHTLMQSK